MGRHWLVKRPRREKEKKNKKLNGNDNARISGKIGRKENYFMRAGSATLKTRTFFRWPIFSSCYLIFVVSTDHVHHKRVCIIKNNVCSSSPSFGHSFGLPLLFFHSMMSLCLVVFFLLFTLLRSIACFHSCLCTLPICGIVLAQNAIAFPYIKRSRTGNSSYTGSSVHVLMFSCLCFYSFHAPRRIFVEQFLKIKTIFFPFLFKSLTVCFLSQNIACRFS